MEIIGNGTSSHKFCVNVVKLFTAVWLQYFDFLVCT